MVLPFLQKGAFAMIKTNTIAQYIICRWIDNNFINVKTELVAPDIVKITDCKGESLLLSMNIHEQILDYNTREILSQ